MKFENKVAIVTGAGRNVGEQVAIDLVSEGACVALIDTSTERLEQVVQKIDKIRSDSTFPIICDVSSSREVQGMVDEVVKKFGAIHFLINNVAVTDHKTIFDLEEDEWDKVIDVSLKGPFLCSKYVAKQIVLQGGGGAIVNLGSTSGMLARGDATAYPTAKAGVLHFTRTIALQLGSHGIRVNSVSPNKVGSPVGMDEEPSGRPRKNVMGRGAVPRDISKAVLFLLNDDESPFITGIDLLVDGGAVVALTAD